MRYTSGKKGARAGRRLIPGFGLTLGITLAMLSILILIPLASILVYAVRMPVSELMEALSGESVSYALLVSVSTSFIAALVNVVFGLILAWVLVRYDFPGKRLLDGLIELPFAMPTAVAGITLSRLYSDQGLFGKALGQLGIRVSYTHLGIVVALIFIGIPFVVRTVQPVLEQLDPFYEEASHMLGADSATTFMRVILPELTPALLTGFGLAFARGIGENGSVIYISGNSARDHTQVASYVIMQRLNYMDYGGATAVALVMLIISFLLLLTLNLIQLHQQRRVGNA